MTRKLLVAVVALVGSAAMAQNTTGSVRITGSVSDVVALRFTSLTSNAGGGPDALDPLGTSTAFNRLFDLGNINSLTPPADGFVRLSLAFQLRSNVPYTVSVQSTETAGSVLPSSLVGFALKSVTPTTDPQHLVTPRADVPDAAFDGTATINGTVDVNGDPVYTVGTLADAIASADILSGNEISLRGSLTSTKNFIAVTTEFALMPELLLPVGTFEHTVIFTAAPTP